MGKTELLLESELKNNQTKKNYGPNKDKNWHCNYWQRMTKNVNRMWIHVWLRVLSVQWEDKQGWKTLGLINQKKEEINRVKTKECLEKE